MRWEHQLFPVIPEELSYCEKKLNELADAGWEVLTGVGNCLLLKRVKPEEEFTPMSIDEFQKFMAAQRALRIK